MPSKKELSWAELKVGVLVIIAVAILSAIVVLVLGVESPFARRYTLYTYLPNIDGLREDSPIMLDGITVGSIDSFAFAEPQKGIRVKMRIQRRYQERIRTDSIAKLRSLGLLGDKYIEINQGSLNGRMLNENEAITGAPPLDLDQMIAKATHTFDNLSDTVDSIKIIAQGLQQGQGTFGQFLKNDELYRNLNEVMGKAGHGKGSISQLLNDSKLYDELHATATNLRAVTDKINNGEGAAGKLVADKETGEKLKNTIAKLDAVMARIDKGDGTLGKLSTDPALYNNLNTVMANLKPVSDGIAKGEGTVGKLFKDKELYDNSNKVMVELQQLVHDIRQDPKKYLRIKFTVF